MDQSLSPDRCLPSLFQEVRLGPGELLVPLPKWKVCVPPAHEILWSLTSLLGCVQWFKAFDIYTGAQHRDKLLAADSVSFTLDGAGAVQLGLWVGLVTPKGLAKSCRGNGNLTASRKPETWKRTQEASPASLPRLIIILWKLDIHLWFAENLREISKRQIWSHHPSASKHSDGPWSMDIQDCFTASCLFMLLSLHCSPAFFALVPHPPPTGHHSVMPFRPHPYPFL